MAPQAVEIILKRGVAAGFFVRRGQLVERTNQRFGHEAAAEISETA